MLHIVLYIVQASLTFGTNVPLRAMVFWRASRNIFFRLEKVVAILRLLLRRTVHLLPKHTG